MRKTLTLGFCLSAFATGLVLLIDTLFPPLPAVVPLAGLIAACIATVALLVYRLRPLLEAGWQEMAQHLMRGRAWCIRLADDLAMAAKQQHQPTVRRMSGYGPVAA